MFGKKGQAAMEFLMTYGWAILIVTIVVSFLNYYGSVNPDLFRVSKCNIKGNYVFSFY